MTVKSCEKTKTSRPSTSPWPVTTASPSTRCSARPNSVALCVTNGSISSKDPASKSRSMRSLAVSFPFACCCWMRRSPPPSRERSRIFWRVPSRCEIPGSTDTIA